VTSATWRAPTTRKGSTIEVEGRHAEEVPARREGKDVRHHRIREPVVTGEDARDVIRAERGRRIVRPSPRDDRVDGLLVGRPLRGGDAIRAVGAGRTEREILLRIEDAEAAARLVDESVLHAVERVAFRVDLSRDVLHLRDELVRRLPKGRERAIDPRLPDKGIDRADPRRAGDDPVEVVGEALCFFEAFAPAVGTTAEVREARLLRVKDRDEFLRRDVGRVDRAVGPIDDEARPVHGPRAVVAVVRAVTGVGVRIREAIGYAEVPRGHVACRIEEVAGEVAVARDIESLIPRDRERDFELDARRNHAEDIAECRRGQRGLQELGRDDLRLRVDHAAGERGAVVV